MQQYGETFRVPYEVKLSSHERTHSVWSHLWEPADAKFMQKVTREVEL